MTTSDIFAQNKLVATASITTPTYSDLVSSTIPQQQKINAFNTTSYSIAPNAVKLLPFITNNKGKVKLYTEVNSNIKVGDKVFIMYDVSGVTASGVTDGIILDNFLEFSGCTNYIFLPQMQGYTVLEIRDNNNEITIDRYYDTRFVNKKIYNHYIAEIYVRNATFNGGEIDGVEILNGDFNTGLDTSIDINLVQAIILSGSSFYIRYKNKYDDLYITTNSSINTGATVSVYKPYIYKGLDPLNQDPTPVSSYYTNNNNGYGYNYVYYNRIRNSEINNGYYDNCLLTDCNITGGYFTNCSISGSTIKGGVFYNTPLNNDCTWLYGTWSGGTFPLSVWYNGVWNSGSFIGKEWRDGIFNSGVFSGSTWRTGLFQGGTMTDSIWSGGTFSGRDTGIIINTQWYGGEFNSGTMQRCNWYDGICNGGYLQNVVWTKGTFNGGTLETANWLSGTCNGGTILDSFWSGGTFNGGTYKTSVNIPSLSGGTYGAMLSSNAIVDYTSGLTSRYWLSGTFNGGTFSNALWSGGTFNDGTFTDNSAWVSGTFFNGNFINSNWMDGDFKNGTVTKSYFHNVNWKNGIWNSGTLGVKVNGETPTIYWYAGAFNNGVFGYGNSPSATITNISWYGGDFYNGYFYNRFVDCNLLSFDSWGGFSGGTFHDGYFYGTFWKGVWVNGTFGGCNKSGLLTQRTVKTRNPKYISRKFGEMPIKNQQQGLSNSGGQPKTF